MPIELTRDGKALLSILVEVLRTADPEDPRTFITYSEALLRLNVAFIGGHAGRLLQDRGLDSLAEWAKASGVPAVTGLVVRDYERDPGGLSTSTIQSPLSRLDERLQQVHWRPFEPSNP